MSSPFPLLQHVHDFPADVTLRDFIDPATGLRVLVRKGTFSFCAYLGVSATHLLADVEDLPLRCHYGVTFTAWGSADSPWAAGWYWWGWDYGHFSDVVDIQGLLEGVQVPVRQQKELERALSGDISPRHRRQDWTLDEVTADARATAQAFAEQLRTSQRLMQTALHSSASSGQQRERGERNAKGPKQDASGPE